MKNLFLICCIMVFVCCVVKIIEKFILWSPACVSWMKFDKFILQNLVVPTLLAFLLLMSEFLSELKIHFQYAYYSTRFIETMIAMSNKVSSLISDEISLVEFDHSQRRILFVKNFSSNNELWVVINNKDTRRMGHGIN